MKLSPSGSLFSRSTRALSEIMIEADYPKLLQAFSMEQWFFHLMGHAQKDLSAKKDRAAVSLSTAFALVLHEDMKKGEEGAAGDRAVLLGSE